MKITYEIKTTNTVSPLIHELNEQLQLNVDIDGFVQLRKFLFDLVDLPLKLVSIETRTTGGTLEALLNPTDLLLDLLSAIRAGDFERFIVEHTHDVVS